jgi:hypothetical protein
MTENINNEVARTANEHAPQKMTFLENVVMTIKVLTGFGLLGAALWGIELLTMAK